MTKKINSSIKIILRFVSLFLLLIPSLLFSANSSEKTPNDVYAISKLLKNDVLQLRKEQKITTPWPLINKEKGLEPKHVFQKGLEILEKIDRYRTNIIKVAGITIPNFSGRDISPNEVYHLVMRLHKEIKNIIEKEFISEYTNKMETNKIIKPEDVYALLSEISIALDETLGLRGITPTEVYNRSLQVLQLVNFLRSSQSLPNNINKPKNIEGNLPNHALQEVHKFQQKIYNAEINLWMKPYKPKIIPKRVIIPGDVYDALGVSIAELRSIQYRLGLERQFTIPEIKEEKTPDDVIRNIRWATKLLPDFSLGEELQQYDKRSLVKSPNQVYSISKHILKKLQTYKHLRGIKGNASSVNFIQNLKPKHVYGKIIEIIEKIDVLRRQRNHGSIVLPDYPLRKITPTDVYDLAIRLENEITILQTADGDIHTENWNNLPDASDYLNKKSSDVYYVMQQISNLIDVILGVEGLTPTDVFYEAKNIESEINLIANKLKKSFPKNITKLPKRNPKIKPKDVLKKVQDISNIISLIKKRSGIFGLRNITIPIESVVKPSDVFNQTRLIKTELMELKVFLNITENSHFKKNQKKEKSPPDVFQILSVIEKSLNYILNTNSDRNNFQ